MLMLCCASGYLNQPQLQRTNLVLNRSRTSSDWFQYKEALTFSVASIEKQAWEQANPSYRARITQRTRFRFVLDLVLVCIIEGNVCSGSRHVMLYALSSMLYANLHHTTHNVFCIYNWYAQKDSILRTTEEKNDIQEGCKRGDATRQRTRLH